MGRGRASTGAGAPPRRTPTAAPRDRAWPPVRTAALAVLMCGGLPLATAASASAETDLVVRGAGFGHGVGLSQYGAKGMAERGVPFERILRHYYRGTRLGALTDDPTVRVAIRWGGSELSVTGAGEIGGRRLRPDATYVLARAGDGVAVRGPGGSTLGRVPGTAVLEPADGATLSVAGGGSGAPDGAYRGRLEVRADGGGLLAVGAVGLEDYTRGVVAAESPSSWAREALRAQAVAARTYAITSGGGAGRGFDQWPDTRSQVYGGVGAETARTNAAVADTAGRVVTHRGRPATTYFFSTSGGRTEDVENAFGGDPKPWLKAVDDPDDDGSPRHRWQERFSLAEAERRLGGLAPGGLVRIEALRRGSSPRVVRARVVGRDGVRDVAGTELKAELGLDDTWARFVVVTAVRRMRAPGEARPPAGRPGDDAGAGQDGRFAGDVGATLERALSAPVGPGTRTGRRPVVAGRFAPAREGQPAELQRRVDGRWRRVRRLRLGADGRFEVPAPRAGRYVVRSLRVSSPVVRVRRAPR